MSLFCNNCGSQNREGARFCSDCGSELVSITEGGTLSAGTLLDRRYKIIRLIKSGGMGAVYEAEDERFGDRCAVKEMSLKYSSPEEKKYLTERFRQEAKILRTLHHNSLPKVIDYFTEYGRYYLVMDFVDGEDLETILAGHDDGLDEKQVIKYAIEVLEVLHHLHTYNPPILYRDLKPSNIMIRKSDQKVMLIDFGIARSISEETPSPQTRVGTPNYAAPEQFIGKNEQRSDIYSLGATMHHLITNQVPIPCSLPPIRQIKPSVSTELEKILQKSLSLDIEQRYKSASDMKEDLAELGEKNKKNKRKRTEPIESGKKGMIIIPAGECILGSATGSEKEYPTYRVYLDAYYIDRFPVTNREYLEFTKATGYRSKGNWRNYCSPASMEHPVIGISWPDATTYASWRGKRLPTEAEWEKAARGSGGLIYPWGNDWDKDKCNNRDMDRMEVMAKMINISDGRGTSPVDSFLYGASIYEVMDMEGNIREWCSDWYTDDYSMPVISKNPRGPLSGEYKVIKGGSWAFEKENFFRCSRRDKFSLQSEANDIGFRCAMDVKKYE